MRTERTTPAWPWLIAGWLVGATFATLQEDGLAVPAPFLCTLEARDPVTGGITPRELRRIPGIGQARSIALARALWLHAEEAGALDLTSIEGVGPVTAQRVRAYCERFDRRPIESGGVRASGLQGLDSTIETHAPSAD